MKNEEIEIRDILYELVKGHKIIIAFMCVFILLAMLFSAAMSPREERYVANASMVIHSQQARVVSGELIYENVIYLSQQMVNTYQVILTSDRVLERISADLGITTPPETLRAWININSPKDSEVLMITVRNTDPVLATNVANSLMRVAPGVIAETVEVGTVNVVDYAKVPRAPAGSPVNLKLNLAVAAVVGFMLAIFLLFMIRLFQPKVRNSRDIAEILSLNVLGEITHSSHKETKTPLITHENIERHFIESFKIAALNTLHLISKSNYKKLLVTSSSEKEGKTTCSRNLGIALAQTGKSVILMDCDFYRTNYLLNYTTRKCLIDVLTEDIDYTEVLIKEDSGLHILPSKGRSADQKDLLNSKKMKDLINVLEKDYDLIIIDTPPLDALSDAAYLSKLADGVILVVKQEHEITDNLIAARDTLLSLEADIIGCILNDIRYTIADVKYYDKYRHDYSIYESGGFSRGGKPAKSVTRVVKRTARNKYFVWIVLVFWLVVIGFFATRTGDQIIQMNETTMDFIFRNLERVGFIEDRTGLIEDKVGDLTLYGTEIHYWVRVMEHWIHAILFLALTLISLGLMRLYNFSIAKKSLLTFLLCTVFLIGNEVYQSLVVVGRGYETQDVLFGYVGVIAGFFVHFTHQLIRRSAENLPAVKTKKTGTSSGA